MQTVRRRGVALLALTLAAAAAALDPPAATAQLSGLPVVRGPAPLTDSRGELRWRLSALVQRIPAPLPSAPRRSEDLSCLVLRHADIRETRCLDGEPRLWRSVDGTTYELGANAGSARRRYLLWGFATRQAAVVVVVLGDGRRVRVRPRRLPAELRSGARWFAWAPSRDDAVRGVVVLDARGRAIARLAESLPPAAVRGAYGLTLVTPARPVGTQRVAAGPLPNDRRARLIVRRVGARVCADIDRANLLEPACGLPPRTAEESLIAGRGTAGGDTLGGVVADGVAAVELSASIGGASVRVPTQPAKPSAGPFRVFLGQLPFSGLAHVRLFDAGGRTVGSADVSPAYSTGDAAEDATRRLLRGRAPGGGAFVLRGDAAGLCLALTAPGRNRPDAGGSTCGLDRIELLVPCRPRVAAVVSPATRRARLHVITSDGNELRGRLVRLPEGRRAWVVPIPSRAEPRAVAWREGRRPGGVGLGSVPAPARQCGYVASPGS
jgi:hypothetical protein